LNRCSALGERAQHGSIDAPLAAIDAALFVSRGAFGRPDAAHALAWLLFGRGMHILEGAALCADDVHECVATAEVESQTPSCSEYQATARGMGIALPATTPSSAAVMGQGVSFTLPYRFHPANT